MNDMRLKQSIQRWEYEGGALLPRDSNVHFRRYRAPEWQQASDEDQHLSRDFIEAPRLSLTGEG